MNQAAAPSRVVGSVPLWTYGKIGGGLSPAHVSAIVREAESGRPARLYDFVGEARRKDPHLQATLGVNETSISGLAWTLSLPEDATANEKAAAAWVEQQLRRLDLRALIARLAGAVVHGFSVVEIVWSVEGGKLVPRSLIPIAPRRFRFRPTDGALVLQDDGGPEMDLLGGAYPHKFIASRPTVTNELGLREGLCWVIAWASYMRTATIADWMRAGELSWKPYRIGSYAKGTTSVDDRRDLETVLRKITTDFAAVIPDSCKIDVLWPSGTQSRGSSHAELVTHFANEISKAVLGQTETTQASASSGYAQAKVHREVKADILAARARQIAADVTRDLIEPMLRLNFSAADLRTPIFTFDLTEAADIVAIADAASKLADAGLVLSAAWLRDQIGHPLTIRPGEETIGGPKGGGT